MFYIKRPCSFSLVYIECLWNCPSKIYSTSCCLNVVSCFFFSFVTPIQLQILPVNLICIRFQQSVLTSPQHCHICCHKTIIFEWIRQKGTKKWIEMVRKTLKLNMFSSVILKCRLKSGQNQAKKNPRRYSKSELICCFVAPIPKRNRCIQSLQTSFFSLPGDHDRI